MGMFNAPTPKPTRLWSNSSIVDGLARPLDKSRHFEKDDGLYSVNEERKRRGLSATTGHAGLKKTQAYPMEYGAAVAEEFGRAQRKLAAEPVDSDAESEGTAADPTDPWDDAELGPVAAL
eukprot:2397730-Alexandrium_andersonii.AAC.1